MTFSVRILLNRSVVSVKISQSHDSDLRIIWIQERYLTLKRCILIEKVPDELKGLSQLEEILIARIYPLITVYTVKGGQQKGSKHVINFPQDLNRLATQLPRYLVRL